MFSRLASPAGLCVRSDKDCHLLRGYSRAETLFKPGAYRVGCLLIEAFDKRLWLIENRNRSLARLAFP